MKFPLDKGHFITGGSTESYGWGVGIFLLLILLQGIPLISGVFTLAFSLIESICLGGILSSFTSAGWSWFISICIFYVLVELHRTFGKVDYVSFGYSLIIFDGLIISGVVYLLYGKIAVPVIIFVTIFVLAFIPVLRVIESVLLTLLTTISMYGMASITLEKPYSLFVAAFAFIYSGISYIAAYLGIDYIGLARRRKSNKEALAKEAEIQEIKNRLYVKLPEVEKNYYYFYTEVCKTDFDRKQFDSDWNMYLEYLDRSSNIISFNEYFEQEKLYRTSHYNSDFAQKYSEWKQTNSHADSARTGSVDSEKQSSIYFAGVNSLESLKKRYHDLLKIYHPDNQNGDNTASKQIQQEYEELLKKYNNEL